MADREKYGSGDVLRQLQDALDCAEGSHRATPPVWKSAPLRTGSPLDRLLPRDGLRRGTLVEWLRQGPGSGATTLALWVARAAVQGGGALVVIDRPQQFYAPAAVALAVDPSQLIIVRPDQDADEVWALDQAARCTGVAAVLWRGKKLDARHFRRLQLACEASGVIGLLVRPHTARREPSWADLRLLVQPCAGDYPDPRRAEMGQSSSPAPVRNSHSLFSLRRLRVQLLRCHTRTAATVVELEIDHETAQIREATALRMATLRATRRQRRTGA